MRKVPSVAPAAPAAASATANVALVVKSRTSRLPTQAVLEALRAAEGGRTVPSLAAELGVPERDVRLAIDKLRVLKFLIVRSALKTFTLASEA